MSKTKDKTPKKTDAELIEDAKSIDSNAVRAVLDSVADKSGNGNHLVRNEAGGLSLKPAEDKIPAVDAEIRSAAIAAKMVAHTRIEAGDAVKINADGHAESVHHGYPPHSPGEGIISPLGQVPSIGRSIHFVSPEFPEPIPGVISAVLADGTVDLTLFPPRSIPRWASEVPKGPSPNHLRYWFWPPRV